MSTLPARLAAAAAVVIGIAVVIPANVWGAQSALVAVSAMWSPPNNFNPINTDSSYGFYAVRFMFTGLVGSRVENNQMQFTPALASRWDVGADRQTFTFTLHPQASWHDGQPVTSDDVLFTIMTVSDPRTETNRGANIAAIAGLDARGKRAVGGQIGFRSLGPKAFEVKTKAPVDPAFFLETFGSNLYIIPKHILADVPPDQLSRHPFFQRPTVGNGPYKFVQYRTDEFVEFASNDSYHLGAPHVRRLFLRIIPPTTMLAQLQRGDLDLTAGFGIGEILVDDWDRVKTLSNLQTISFPAPGYQYMLINWQRPYLQDKRVRRALAQAINRSLIVSQLLKGQGQVAEGPIPPVTPYFNKQVKPWPYDPAQARALLQEAGWDFNRTLTLRVPVGNVVRERSAEIVRENLVAVGVKTDLQKSDFPTHIAALRNGTYDLGLVGWTGLNDPDVSSQYRTGGQYNFSSHSIPQMDQLLDEGVRTADPAKRHQIYDQFQELFADQMPVVVLYYNNALTVVARRMHNVLRDAQGQYDFAPYNWTAGPQ